MKNAALPKRIGSQPHAGQQTHGLNPQTKQFSAKGCTSQPGHLSSQALMGRGARVV